MEWFKRMADALEYMEHHMEEPFDAAKISKAAYSSPFHFQRMFHMLTGVTAAEYVRKRKLTLAAQELAVSGAKVLDIALKYGYDTPESFSKAFRKVHGIPPSAVRETGASLKAFPRISFQLSLKGDQEMDYRIVEKEAFQVVGKLHSVSTRDGENLRRIPQFWLDCNKDGTYDRLCGLRTENEVLGLCLDIRQEEERFNYMIAVNGSDKGTNDDFTVREIPASTWAVFHSVGPMPGAIQKVWSRIYQEWFPATGYEHAGTADMEVYPDGDPQAADYYCEVWIPIVKK